VGIAWSNLRGQRGQTYVLSGAIGSSVALVAIVNGLMQSAAIFASGPQTARNPSPLITVALRDHPNNASVPFHWRIQNDVETIRNVLGRDGKPSSELRGIAVARARGGEVITTVGFAVSEGWFNARSVVVSRGRTFTPREFADGSSVVVIGPKTATDLFGIRDPLDQVAQFGGKPSRIVGIGRPFFSGSDDTPVDDFVIVPSRSEFARRLNREGVSLYIQPTPLVDLDAVAANTIDALRQSHRLSPLAEDDFSVFVPGRKVSDFWSTVSASFNLAAIALTSIALFGSGILLRTAMYVAVRKRRYEIGIRRAVGAKRTDILAQFVLEALSICMLGGILGLAVGESVLVLAHLLLKDRVVIVLAAPWFAIGSVVILALLGGLQPARRASHLNPIDALRA
jgi:ABC-type antimicrobial peptide transport system permease subunit